MSSVPTLFLGPAATVNEDAVSALVNLGYRRAEAYGAVAKAIGDAGKQANLNDLIVSGLKELAQ